MEVNALVSLYTCLCVYAGSKDGLEAELSSVKRELAKAEGKSDELSIALDQSHQKVTALQQCIAMVNTLKVRVHFEVVCVVHVCTQTYVHVYIVSL